MTYKDELCVKYYTDLLPYDEAKEACQQASSSLVMVKEPEMQELLANYTGDIFDNLWLGGRYNNETSEFTWEDGEPIDYSNWQEGYPRNTTDGCIELRPQDSKASSTVAGGWADVACQKRNGVLCQKELSWTLKDAVNEIIRLRKQLHEEVTDLKQVDLVLTDEIAAVKAVAVPVGSIYIEYYAQVDPETLWPSLSWLDVSSSYSGMFFRAIGGDSENWGAAQADCAPRITEMSYTEKDDGDLYPSPLTIPKNGWSEFGRVGYYQRQGPWSREGLQFKTEHCEVRPKNLAIRLWKRIA